MSLGRYREQEECWKHSRSVERPDQYLHPQKIPFSEVGLRADYSGVADMSAAAFEATYTGRTSFQYVHSPNAYGSDTLLYIYISMPYT